MIICNTRNLQHHLTGVQRYTHEILKRIDAPIQQVAPQEPLRGMKGHLWEQLILPKKIGANLLWSPSNTGPIFLEKQVVTIHDLSPLDHPEWTSRKFSSWYRLLIPRLIRTARLILTDSEYTKDRIEYFCNGSDNKIVVTPLGASKDFSRKNKEEITHAIDVLKLPSPHYLITVGSLEPRKNLSTLLRSWEQISSQLPKDIWLVLVGAIGEKDIFAHQSYNRLPERVFLTGHVNDELLPALYSGALASVYVSLYEGFGLPALEAISCGTPLIHSNTTSIPEVVGDSGICVNPLDAAEIGEAMRLVADSAELRQKLSQNGLKQSMLFGWDKTAKLVAAALKEADH
jgi:glycosyltransferase involved in cell wall biosynthesis